ncbi:MAG: glycosyltransferase family 2 protein [Deltaproteobacteria bacterium]|nr:glycosyltransferase family 2 protein [Deltaproteobacteria bacterium]
MMDVSAIVVSHNNRVHLVPCLESLQTALERLWCEIWLVDNASSDGGPEEVRNLLPWVKFIRNDRNIGFARANNQAIRSATGRYILLLNPDTLLHRQSLIILVNFLKHHPKVGIVGPAVYDEENFSNIQMSARSFPSFSTPLYHRYSPLARLWKNNPWSRRYLQIDLDRDRPSRVDWVSACCLMVRRDVLDGIGLLDEQFWMFAEDVDLCRRAWQGGWEVAYEPRAKVVHFIGASRGKVSARVVVERHRSMWIYYRKHEQKNPLVSGLVLGGIALRCVIHLAMNAIRKNAGKAHGLA